MKLTYTTEEEEYCFELDTYDGIRVSPKVCDARVHKVSQSLGAAVRDGRRSI